MKPKRATKDFLGLITAGDHIWLGWGSEEHKRMAKVLRVTDTMIAYKHRVSQEEIRSKELTNARNRLGLKVVEIQLRLPDTLLRATASLSEFPKDDGPAEQYDIHITNMSHGRAMLIAQLLNDAVSQGKVPECEQATLVSRRIP